MCFHPFRLKKVFTIVFIFGFALQTPDQNLLVGQDTCVGYRLVPQTVYDKSPVKMNKWVNETVNEKQTITSYKPVYKTEKRERRTTVLKPVRKTSTREEKYIVRRPVVETSYQEREVEETTYETVTEMRDQEVVIETPVYETQMREDKVVVRRPVTETTYQSEIVTTYRPTVVSSTQLTPANMEVSQLVPAYGGRPRARWLPPGYYLDPNTGLTVWRSRGFHWVQPPTGLQLQTSTVPVLTPQQVQKVELIPETQQVQKPVQVTRYVETVETRKVPIQIQKTQRRTEVRKVPVTVTRPKTIVRKEKIPYETTRYVDEVRVRKIPVTETTYERVEEVVPYEVETVEWVAVTQEIEVPQVRRKLVQVDMIKHTPRTVMMKVPVDAFGNIVGTAQPLNGTITSTPTIAVPESQTPPPVVLADREPELAEKSLEETSSSSEKSVLENNGESSEPIIEYHARPELRKPESEPSETSSSKSKTDQDLSTSKTTLVPIRPRTMEEQPDPDLPRAKKPTRSHDSSDEPADMVPALDSRPSQNPPEINGPTEKDLDKPEKSDTSEDI